MEKILIHLNEKATAAGIGWNWMFKHRTIQARAAELDRISW
jgi:hypothetical protein